MATTHFDPAHRGWRKHAKIRPVLTPVLVRGRGGAWPHVTEPRTRGVAVPTLLLDDRQRSAGPAALVEEAAEAALESLSSLERQTRCVADHFRTRALPDARRGLIGLVESTQTLIKLAVLTALAASTTLDTLAREEGLSARERMSHAVDQLITRQLEENWDGVADVLTDDFIGALAEWRLVFAALGGYATTPGDAA